MEKEIDQEVMDMCNFRDFIEQRGIEQGLLLKAEGKVEGNVEACFLIIEENAVLKGDVQAGKLLVKAVKYDIKRLRLVRK